ncbi:STAS domain-containing protein [Streptosporangium subroseum]|uniref:STAS domain-containing protein n=1 Tax=Streptosporangium subroseum TaxID=106412 RepID=UPI003085899F|nr:STAS domain-containing protein [Streptosporangium subroseum]
MRDPDRPALVAEGVLVTDAVQLALHPDGTLPRTLIVTLSGELDYDNAEALRTRFLALLDDDYRCLVLDLTKLTFCDSTGIRIFLALRELIDDRGGIIALTDLHPRLVRIFQMTGLVRFFAVHPSRADALAILRDQPSAS